MNEMVRVNGHDLSVKEYNGKRVVTFKEIDTVHERPCGTARKRFSDNKKHFIEGEDFFKVKCSEVRPFFGQTPPNGFNPNGDVTLVTESGYYMLVKSFTDDLSWDVQRELVNNYFKISPYEFRTKQTYQPTRPLTTDDYEEAAKTIAKCHNKRLPIVIDLYRKAGLDIQKLEDMGIENEEDDLVELLNRYTLAELVEMLGIARTSLYYYRKGKVRPCKKRMNEIIRILKEYK